MKVCWRGLNWMQIVDPQGDARMCGWCKDGGIVGNILKAEIPEIMHGEKMRKLVSRLAAGDYSNCALDSCPYLSNDNMDKILVDSDEIPDWPEFLSLSFEYNCNYRCTCCSSHGLMEAAKCRDWSENLDRIAEKLESILPHIRQISAHGMGELFASPRTLKLLGNWKPLAPREECKVMLETNGSLFTPENWKKIENLGQYDLSVIITVMSFQEDVYQLLSGTKLPLSVIENNLKFVRSLREQGVIDHLSLASVLQEANFREMPLFIQRCFDEFGADRIYIRQLWPGGRYDRHIQWFMDVRNPEHPYYELYRKVLEHPVFRDPRVMLQAGFLPSGRGENPGVLLERRLDALQGAVDKMLDAPELLLPRLPEGRLAVFGLGTVGKLFIRQYAGKREIVRAYATNPKFDAYGGVPVTALCEAASHGAPDAILLTPYSEGETVSKQLREAFREDITLIDFWDIIRD